MSIASFWAFLGLVLVVQFSGGGWGGRVTAEHDKSENDNSIAAPNFGSIIYLNAYILIYWSWIYKYIIKSWGLFWALFNRDNLNILRLEASEEFSLEIFFQLFSARPRVREQKVSQSFPSLSRRPPSRSGSVLSNPAPPSPGGSRCSQVHLLSMSGPTRQKMENVTEFFPTFVESMTGWRWISKLSWWFWNCRGKSPVSRVRIPADRDPRSAGSSRRESCLRRRPCCRCRRWWSSNPARSAQIVGVTVWTTFLNCSQLIR